jgi:small-conductance mechanosensitive channel
MNDLLSIEVLGSTLQEWGVALSITIGALFLIYVFKQIIVKRITRLTARTETYWDDAVAEVLAKTHFLFLFIIALFFGSLSLEVSDNVRQGIHAVTAIALILQGGRWINHLIVFLLRRDLDRRRAHDPASVATVTAAVFVARLLLWSVVVLLALDNVGVDITALVAGLGVGGVAVALAVQNILGDLFASLSIVLDKPFAVGDFLIIGDLMGSVEYVGLKTTRLRSLSGEQLIFSNTDLLGSRIRNYGRMHERRVVFNIGVTYQTPHNKLAEIPGMIQKAIEEQDNVRFDRSHFQKYGDFSLNFETVYYVLSPDYNLYMDIQQAINLRIHELFEQQNIEFAYPTQTLFVQGMQGQPQSEAM